MEERAFACRIRDWGPLRAYISITSSITTFQLFSRNLFHRFCLLLFLMNVGSTSNCTIVVIVNFSILFEIFIEGNNQLLRISFVC